MPETPESPIQNPPTCISVVICNEIIEDKRTNNKTLVSLFNSIVVKNVPTTHPRMFVMASLTDARGQWPISFIVRSPQGEDLVRFEAQAVFYNPVSVVDISVEILGLSLPELGVYFVDVMTDTYPLGSRRFTVFSNRTQSEGARPDG